MLIKVVHHTCGKTQKFQNKGCLSQNHIRHREGESRARPCTCRRSVIVSHAQKSLMT